MDNDNNPASEKNFGTPSRMNTIYDNLTKVPYKCTLCNSVDFKLHDRVPLPFCKDHMRAFDQALREYRRATGRLEKFGLVVINKLSCVKEVLPFIIITP
jgi:hypothetical protein